MDFDVLAILFIVFSIGSSLVAKWQERQRQGSGQNEPRPRRRRQTEPKPDLSEWDVFGEEKPKPQRNAREEEFIPVRGERRIEEPVSGPEFREADVQREIREDHTGPEFREADVARPITESVTGPEYRRISMRRILQSDVKTRMKPVRYGRSRKQVRIVKTPQGRIRVDAKGLKRGILYSEILGPPRGETMPW